MELAVGTIISGKVTAITKFGAFVSLPGGKSGLVHISEVAAAFVSDVHDYLTEGQEVTVKILSVSPEGKINLSIKQAQPQQERPQPARSARPQGGRPGPRSGGRSPRPAQAAVAMQPPAEPSFEDKLKQFMTQSDSKQSELNRYMAGKRGSGAAGAGEDNGKQAGRSVRLLPACFLGASFAGATFSVRKRCSMIGQHCHPW